MAQAFKKVEGNIDTSVKIPDAVLRAAAAADEAQKKFLESEGKAVDEPTPPAPPAPTPPPPPPAEARAAPKDEPQPGSDEWKQRYEQLQGRLGRQQGDLRALSDQVANLTRALEVERASKAPPPKQEPYAKLVTDEERTDYGEDFLDVVKRAAREEFEPVKRQLEHENAALKAQLTGFGAQVEAMSEQEMFQATERAYPNWDALNRSDPWKAWLAMPDPFDGQRRLDKIQRQWGLRNVSSVLNFVRAFLNEEAALRPAEGSERTDTSAPSRANGKVPLENYAAPGRAKSAAASSAPADKAFYTREQIEQFYRDVTAGRYRGRDQERIAIDHDIMAAQHEGRIQQSRPRMS